MKLTYLGTGASEGWPAVFCSCDNCRRARTAGGRNIRTRSQAMINSDLVFDFPADTYHHILTNGLDAEKWRYLFITHTHSDHFYPADLAIRRPPYGYPKQPLSVFGNEAVRNALEPLISELRTHGCDLLDYTPAECGKQITAGKYTVLPLRADHLKSETGLFYAVSDGRSSLLYAHDTGFFPEEVFTQLRGMRFDAVSLDCTFVTLPTTRVNHMSMDVCREVANRLIRQGCADGKTRFVLNHFSHNGVDIYDELVPKAAALGFEVAYDGMIMEF